MNLDYGDDVEISDYYFDQVVLILQLRNIKDGSQTIEFFYYSSN